MRVRVRSVLACKISAPLWPAAATFALVLFSTVVFGQSPESPTGTLSFTAIDLNPSGFVESWASGISGGQQVGDGSGPATGGQVHALLWRGSGASVVDLHPQGFVNSRALGTSGGEQVGYGQPDNWYHHALLWRGNAGRVVDLHPTGFDHSGAVGISGGQQVGWGRPSHPGVWQQAVLWRGSAASVVDIDPNGSNSQAMGTSGTEQVGYGESSGRSHALLWRSGANGPMDLHPKAFIQSYAVAISDGQQVGYGSLNPRLEFMEESGPFHALLWSDSPGSMVDLHPRGFADSQALGISGGQQVGWGAGATTGNFRHALLWRSTAASVVDLHAFLPPGFVGSIASGVDVKGNIVGVAWGPASDNWNHAFLWKRSVGAVR